VCKKSFTNSQPFVKKNEKMTGPLGGIFFWLTLYTSTMGRLGDGSHRGQGCQAWTAVGLPLQYPRSPKVGHALYVHYTGWPSQCNAPVQLSIDQSSRCVRLLCYL